jgi:hypothetical protein
MELNSKYGQCKAQWLCDPIAFESCLCFESTGSQTLSHLHPKHATQPALNLRSAQLRIAVAVQQTLLCVM